MCYNGIEHKVTAIWPVTCCNDRCNEYGMDKGQTTEQHPYTQIYKQIHQRTLTSPSPPPPPHTPHPRTDAHTYIGM